MPLYKAKVKYDFSYCDYWVLAKNPIDAIELLKTDVEEFEHNCKYQDIVYLKLISENEYLVGFEYYGDIDEE